MSLQQIAKQLVAPGKGILAADESTGTITKRLASIDVESTEETRRAYRELLFSTPHMGDYISGVIMYDETIRQRASDGHTFVTMLENQGVIPGIKVDLGVEVFNDSDVEKYTKGFDGLEDRLKEYYNMGARFTKWRAVFTISDTTPTDELIEKNAKDLAQYAKLCQDSGLVPIVEPEVLMDSTPSKHSIDDCYRVTVKVQKKVFEALHDAGVDLSGMLLKPNMIVAGKDFGRAPVEEVAQKTMACLTETVPAEVPGIVFLSGGQSETEANENLNAIAQKGTDAPWQLSFSFGRGLQASALDAWRGKEDNVATAQEAFLRQAKMSSEARLGELG